MNEFKNELYRADIVITSTASPNFVIKKEMVEKAIGKTIEANTVTYDLHRQMEGAVKVSCSSYADEIVKQ